MYSFTWSHSNRVKWSWETGHLREVGNFAWGSVFTGSGTKIGWRIVLTIWFFCYAKNGVVNQSVVGGFYWWEKQLNFLASVGDWNPPVGKILTCTLKNHNLLFIIKHFESILGIIKKYLVMNIWKYTIEHKFQKKYFCEQFSENLLMMV